MNGATVVRIERRPVKGLGEERLAEVAFSAGRGLPGDRRYAVAHARAAEAATAGAWAHCRNFIRPTTSATLAAARVAAVDGAVEASHPSLGRVRADLSDEAGRAALARWAEGAATAASPAPYSVVDVGRNHLADDERPGVSIGSMASLRALEAFAGRTLDPRRFRLALWMDGPDLEPWAEAALIGVDFRLGAAAFRGLDEIVRCASPGADPETGERDADVVALLREVRGATTFGVLAHVSRGGGVAVGDAIEID